MTLRQIKLWVRQQIANMGARVARVAASSAVRLYELEGRAGGQGEEGADEEPYQDATVLYQHYGFRSRPGPRSEAVSVACGGSSQRVTIATEAPGTGPNDQVDGEVEVYSKFGQRIRHLADGRTELTVASGAGVLAKPDGSLTLASGTGGGYAVMSGNRLSVNSEVVAERVYVGGGAPSVTTLNANVTLATLSRGRDAAFEVEITVAPSPAVGTVATVTYSRAWSSAPVVTVVQKGSAEKLSWSATTTALTLTCAAPGLPAGTYSLVVTSVGLL